MTTPIMPKTDAAELINAARIRQGLTWATIAEKIDAPLVWTVAALLGKQLGVRPHAWRKKIGPYADEGSRRSVADVTDETSLQQVRDFKKAQKAQEKAAAAK